MVNQPPKLSLPSPEPLIESIAALKEHRQKLAALAQEKIEVTRAIDDYIATAFANDDQKNLRVAGQRVRLELLPLIVARLETELPGLAQKIIGEVKAFSLALVIPATAEREAMLDKVEAQYKPVTPDTVGASGATVNAARNLAMRAPIVQNIRWTEEGWPAPPLSIAESGNNPLAVGSNADEIAARLGAALARGEGLIRFYNAVKKAGTFSFDALKLT